MFNDQLTDVLRQAQLKALAIHVFPTLPEFRYRHELEEMIINLTEPDPKKRGDRKARRGGIVGIDRFHQKLHRIAARVSFEEALKSI
jgi:hypothetical protein